MILNGTKLPWAAGCHLLTHERKIAIMPLSLPVIFLLQTHLKPAELHELEESIPTLTYDVNEAEVVLGKVSRKQRAQFELRRLKLETEPVRNGAAGDGFVENDGFDGRYSKRRKLESPRSTVETDSSLVRVLNLSWLTESMEKGELLPMSGYIVYEGRKRRHITSKLVNGQTDWDSRTTSDILERAADDKTELDNQLTPWQKGKKNAEVNVGTFPSAGSILKPGLIRQSTSEHDIHLPLIPDYLHTSYSCQRPTPNHPLNTGFIDELKSIRTLRVLQGDKIGVRAYSTSIASIAAYPYQIQSPQGTSLVCVLRFWLAC